MRFRWCSYVANTVKWKTFSSGVIIGHTRYIWSRGTTQNYRAIVQNYMCSTRWAICRKEGSVVSCAKWWEQLPALHSLQTCQKLSMLFLRELRHWLKIWGLEQPCSWLSVSMQHNVRTHLDYELSSHILLRHSIGWSPTTSMKQAK